MGKAMLGLFVYDDRKCMYRRLNVGLHNSFERGFCVFHDEPRKNITHR
jgi:hypothetical protein